MTQTKDQVAARLAESHYISEGGISQIYRIRKDGDGEDAAAEPIKLLEVNINTVPTGITPVYFGPREDRGIPYARVIVDLTPEEFVRVQAREMPLPNGWRLGEALMRPAAAD